MGALKKQQGSNESKNTQQSNSNQDSVLAILDFMNSYAQKLSFSADKKFVFVLGNTGAGMCIILYLRLVCCVQCGFNG